MKILLLKNIGYRFDTDNVKSDISPIPILKHWNIADTDKSSLCTALPGGGFGKVGNRVLGDYTGALLPEFMDREGTAGQLQYLKMEATAGSMPQDPFLRRLSVEKAIGGPIFGAFKENKGMSYVMKVRSQEQVNRLLTTAPTAPTA